jgi:hypothetical protein
MGRTCVFLDESITCVHLERVCNGAPSAVLLVDAKGRVLHLLYVVIVFVHYAPRSTLRLPPWVRGICQRSSGFVTSAFHQHCRHVFDKRMRVVDGLQKRAARPSLPADVR